MRDWCDYGHLGGMFGDRRGRAADYTGADFAGWCREVGFRDVEILPLAGPGSAGIAYKQQHS